MRNFHGLTLILKLSGRFMMIESIERHCVQNGTESKNNGNLTFIYVSKPQSKN